MPLLRGIPFEVTAAKSSKFAHLYFCVTLHRHTHCSNALVWHTPCGDKTLSSIDFPCAGQYTFGEYKVLDGARLTPSKEDALQLLYRVASDPGIVAVMNRYHWSVGLLSEMPPEGKVGVDQACVLGYNVNKVGCCGLLPCQALRLAAVKQWNSTRRATAFWRGCTGHTPADPIAVLRGQYPLYDLMM